MTRRELGSKTWPHWTMLRGWFRVAASFRWMTCSHPLCLVTPLQTVHLRVKRWCKRLRSRRLLAICSRFQLVLLRIMARQWLQMRTWGAQATLASVMFSSMIMCGAPSMRAGECEASVLHTASRSQLVRGVANYPNAGRDSITVHRSVCTDLRLVQSTC